MSRKNILQDERVLLGLVILISILDIFMNFASAIPVVGPILETIGEVGLEFLQVAIVSYLALRAMRK